MAEGNDVAESRNGWLPTEIWMKIADEYAPPVRQNTIMDIAPEEPDDTFDPYVLSKISCADFEAIQMRSALAGVNRQLRMLLDGTHLNARDCLVITNDNASRLRERLERAAEKPSARHVAFILQLVPGAGETLDDFAHIWHHIRGIEILSFGAVASPGGITSLNVLAPGIAHFTSSFQLEGSSLQRVAFLDGAAVLAAAWATSDIGDIKEWEILTCCDVLRSLSFHRYFYGVGLQRILGTTPSVVYIYGPDSGHTLSHLIVDSPYVKYLDRGLRGIRGHYIRDGGPFDNQGLLGVIEDTRSPVTYVSLVMATRPVNIDTDFAQLGLCAPSLRHLRLSAPLSQLTSSIRSIPYSVITLVLVVDNSVSWNPQLPPPETVAWERLHKLFLGIISAKNRQATHLERVQFLQSALAEYIRSELDAHADLGQELASLGLTIWNEKNEQL